MPQKINEFGHFFSIVMDEDLIKIEKITKTKDKKAHDCFLQYKKELCKKIKYCWKLYDKNNCSSILRELKDFDKKISYRSRKNILSELNLSDEFKVLIDHVEKRIIANICECCRPSELNPTNAQFYINSENIFVFGVDETILSTQDNVNAGFLRKDGLGSN